MPISRRGGVEPFHVMEVIKAAAARQRSHGDAIVLCVGQPSTGAPAAVRAAAIEALGRDTLGYTEALGTPAIREAIAEHYRATYGVDVPLESVAMVTGSSAGFTALFLAAFDVGDPVVVTRPGYPAYRNTLHALGCDVIELDCGPATRYQPTVAQLEALPVRPKGLIVASPANPTGTVIERDALAAIAAWCEAHDCLLISDEIYHGITYGVSTASAWEFGRASAVVGSFSKYYSMTGWRLGWVLMPEPLARPIELLLGNLNLCAPAPAQAAALDAFSPAAVAELDGHVARYADNRERLLGWLPRLGVRELAPPDGAFYVYADVRHLTDDSTRWCAEALAATGVALTPGVDFAPHVPGTDPSLDGRHYVRISFAGTAAEIDEGMARLATWIGSS